MKLNQSTNFVYLFRRARISSLNGREDARTLGRSLCQIHGFLQIGGQSELEELSVVRDVQRVVHRGLVLGVKHLVLDSATHRRVGALLPLPLRPRGHGLLLGDRDGLLLGIVGLGALGFLLRSLGGLGKPLAVVFVGADMVRSGTKSLKNSECVTHSSYIDGMRS